MQFPEALKLAMLGNSIYRDSMGPAMAMRAYDAGEYADLQYEMNEGPVALTGADICANDWVAQDLNGLAVG